MTNPPLPAESTVPADEGSTRSNRLLAAALGHGVGRPPVWLMRQAGRYMAEYQAIRKDHSFVEMCRDSDLAVEISLQPYRAFQTDAVIVFYDILFLAEAMGAPLEYTERGPVFHKSIRTADDLRQLRMPGPGEGSAPVCETLRRLREELPDEIALLGFAGAPFTMAAYLVEGDFRRSGDRIRRMMHSDPDTLKELLQHLAIATAAYLKEQIAAGAQAVQLFDTWVGLLSTEDYVRFALPFQKTVFDALAESGAPRVLYINGGGHFLDAMRLSGADVLSVDWRVPLAEARRRLGAGIGLQGNLDPSSLFGSVESVREKTLEILQAMQGDTAFIFNLGHGVLPETPMESVRTVIETVRSFEPE